MVLGHDRTVRRTAFIATVSLTAALGVSRSAVAATSTTLGPGPTCAGAVGVGVSPLVTRPWGTPLNRLISLRDSATSLRALLDRVAAAGKFRISYASELLPLNRVVCATFDSVSIGDALVELLQETTVEPAVAGPDQVVLRPKSPRRPDEAPAASRSAQQLDPIVTDMRRLDPDARLSTTTGSISGAQIAARNTTTSAETFDGLVSGLWVWEQSPSSLVTHFGSIRGASSFGLSYPKIYIDGIEVADPLLLSGLNSDAIERVDVIRGPQGAALFGAGAISGVVNIVTRQDGNPDPDRKLAIQARSAAGVSASDFTSGGVLSQDDAFSVRGGSGPRTASAGVSLRTIGDFVKGAASRQLSGYASSRFLGTHTSLSTTVRLFAEDAGSPTNPLLARPAAPNGLIRSRDLGMSPGPGGEPTAPVSVSDSAQPQAMRQYTVGATGTYAPNGRWTYTGTAGMDGYRLSGVPTAGVVSSSVDSALRAARGAADRGTLRAVSSAQFGSETGVSTNLSFAAEQSVLRQQTTGTAPRVGGVAPPSLIGDEPAVWRTNTGLSAQSSVGIHDDLFFNGGARVERMVGYADGTEVALLPALGAAYVVHMGSASLKLRSAYGKAVKPAETTAFNRPHDPLAAMNANGLQPEIQTGIEGGVDLTVGGFATHVTHFNQRATGLLQSVALVDDSTGYAGVARRIDHELESVGAISNIGWELQSREELGRLSLTGDLSLVDSRVLSTTDHYVGDLRAGDRMLEVPAKTLSLTSAWTGLRWSTSWTVSRAADWIGYDRVAMAIAAADSAGTRPLPVGAALRDYWIPYAGVTRIRGTFTRDLFGAFALQITGENLLNQQRGEPDNATIVPGRTITVGLRVKP